MNRFFRRSCNIIMIALLLSCVTYIAYMHDLELVKEQEYLAMRQEYMTKSEYVPEIPQEAIPEFTEEEEPVICCESVFDFAGLQEENEDIYAWLQVPGTIIDYPVLQSEEDNYYLHRNVDGSEGYPGSVYSNKCNTKDFTDGITVLYAHNMRNGTMFADLHKFEDAEFFRENRQILIYTDEARYTYEIYMAAVYGDAYIPAYFDVTSGEGAVTFCEDVEAYGDSRTLIQEGMEITEEDTLLTLSTCVYKEDTKRYLVVGKLIEKAVYME
uniref:class B sortase n=1 Tax=Acetatifactor sp. TaxID=1872090 RepID=UPI004055D09D